jgi:hypothetical protein
MGDRIRRDGASGNHVSILTAAGTIVTRVVAQAVIAAVLLCAVVGVAPQERNVSSQSSGAAPHDMGLLDVVLSGTSPFKESARQMAATPHESISAFTFWIGR